MWVSESSCQRSLEHEAINAYLLGADETMHFTALNNALGRSLPPGALSFGA